MWLKAGSHRGWSLGVTSFHVVREQEGLAFRLACVGLLSGSLKNLLQLMRAAEPESSCVSDSAGGNGGHPAPGLARVSCRPRPVPEWSEPGLWPQDWSRESNWPLRSANKDFSLEKIHRRGDFFFFFFLN